uniref:ATP synthase F0 subunit 8 n=1 Tax=Cerion uva TaxID=1108933 RepID=A0A343AZW2_9EUPU|nr:ATP synthase F0 subunit 8 [Cerion uva]AQL10429.1 ATP synthase F0 subunit 8 [Cerion uva]
MPQLSPHSVLINLLIFSVYIFSMSVSISLLKPKVTPTPRPSGPSGSPLISPYT